MSSPSISQEDEEPQSDGGIASVDDEKPKDEEDGDQAAENKDMEEGVEAQVAFEQPIKVMYQKRDVLDLFGNIGSSQITQFTVLPENNVNCFFQNRAQYWRLSTVDQPENQQETCMDICCDFTYPSTHTPINQGPMAFMKKNHNANAITDSLLMFLKSNNEHLIQPTQNNSAKRFMSQFSANSQYGYQMQPQLSPPQAYHPLNNNGYSNINNNIYAGNYTQQQTNPYMPNNFGTTLALLNNMMNNASKNAANSCQSFTGNNSRNKFLPF